MTKPNCYACKHCRRMPGDAHIQCVHPKSGNTSGDGIFGADFTSMLLLACGLPTPAWTALDITAGVVGMRRGWFSWPFNYDPVWLLSCNGFEEQKTDGETCNSKPKS